MEQLTARPLVLSDAAQIVEINREMEQAEPADAHWSVDEVVEELESPTADLPRASLGLFDGDRMVAYSMVAVVSDDVTFKPHIDGGVRTAWTRRGLGTRVLQVAEEQARAWKQRDAPDLAGELTLWLEESRNSTVALAEAQEYETWRYFFRMQRDLSAPVDIPDAPEHFTIRPYTPDDSETARTARNLAFADHWGSVVSSPERWQAHMVGSQSFRPDISFVALFDDGPHAGEVAAFVLSEEFVGETEARGFRTAYVALVGTVREARGHGLASVLLARQLEAAHQAGYAHAELGVDSDSPTGAGRVYERAGFVELQRNRVVGKHFR